MAAIVDRLIHIMDEQNLTADDIEKIEITPHAIGFNRMWQENALETEEDFGFHGPYLVACAVHRITPVDYQNPEVREDPKIREFMKKVTMLPYHHPNFGPSMLEDRITRVMKVTVWAKGTSFSETSRYIEWSWRPPEMRASDEDLVTKLNEIVTGFLPTEKLKKATDALLTLEKVKDVNELMGLLVP
jgi:2-methylcitrate dehydratase PrpD